MATTAWSGNMVTFPIDRDTPIHRAGWTVRQEPEIRAERAVERLRELTEAAWEAGDTRHAIRCARRVLAAESHLERMTAAYPPLQAHGPIEHWASTLTNTSASLNRFWQKVAETQRESMTAQYERMMGTRGWLS